MQWLCVLLVLMPVHSVNSELSEPQNITRSPCTDSNHLFLAPGVLTAGGTNRACVSRFYPEGPARMVLKLLSEDQPATVSRELPPGDGGCIDIAVPQKPNTKAKLVVNLWYPDAKCSWEREVSVLISAGRLVVVHTERARYRPGETLRARVIALKPDLTPAHGQIDEIWVEGPRGAWDGTRVVQWLRARTRMGIAQVQHELDELAPAGRWTIRARLADGSQGSAVFLVGNYELPPFQLSVRHAPRVLRTSERLVWTVCVRYPWTEAVEGMLVIRIRGAGGTTVAQEASSSIKTVVRIKAPRACHRHAAAARRVGLNGTNPPDVVVADFSFQEDGTRIWQNTTVVSHVVDKPVTLEFLRKLRAVISPGLPYKLKVKATRWDDKPAADELVRVCRSGTELPGSLPHAPAANGTCQDAVTDDRGIARVTFTASADGSSYYSFQASLQNDSSVSAAPLHLAARRASLHASLGPIKPDANSARTFVPLYINLRNISRPLTVHFVVITRGGIIYRWGATTQCPLTSSSDYIPTTSRDTQCFNYDSSAANYQTNESRDQNNAANYQSNTANYHPNRDNYQSNTANYHPNSDNYQNTTSYQTDTAKLAAVDPDSLLDRHLLRVMLPIKVTHQMCPDSHLVAYFYYNGEFVSASKQFEMEECFSNKVEATWLSRQVAPGSMASLRVTTPGPALCALSVLDSASKWNQPAPTLKELVMTSLRRLMDSHRNLTEYEADGACYKESGDIPDLPTNSLELTSTWLAAAGVRVAGGDAPQTRRCSSPPAPLMDDATVPRSDFSEAWLWRLTAVGSNGSSSVSARAPDSISRFEAGAVCLARTGISVSQPAVLQVFREFFIHADGPRRLRRGDSAIFRYRLFNYLYEPLSVQIQILTDDHLSGPAELVESACVPARASVARRAELRARADGRARLAIRAKSVSAPGCGNTTSRTTVSDEVIIPITVDPEGVPVQEHKSILLCGRGSLESGRSDVSWSWPPIQPVPGTEALTVWAMGDIKGPLLFDADGLVQLPRGCGEQNMARLAANLLALQQLPPHSPAAATAREHVARGFTRQLQYAHPAGGFSAFGAKDAAPSTWLTAFALKHMRRAHQVLNPELPIPPALDRAERWLLSQQMENGCFRNEGQVFHRELRGGLNEEGEIASVALTAYVVTALADSGASVRARVVRDALSCLRALPRAAAREPARVYAHALLAYAFMRLRAYEDEMRKSNEASLLWDKKEAVGAGLKDDEELRELMELLQLARRSQDYVWWETSSLATSVEATAYALLALSYCPAALRGSRCAPDARAAVRWLSAHRNHAGGFQSTQDTLVALEALSSWSSAQPSAPPALTVRVVSDGELKKTFISPDVKVPEIIRLTGKSKLDVSVEGTGCALIQATRSYNTLASDQSKDKSLTVQATVHTDGAFDCDSNGTNCFCAAVIEVCVAWAGRFPEMCVVEAWLPPAFGADAARLYRLLQPTDALLRRIELSPNGGRATLYLAGADVTDGGHRCFPLHAVGPRARSKPAHVRVTDYYAPTTNHTQMYTIPEDCPPRITESTNEYLRSHNLFEKARSVTDSGEVLITHEYSFEDIPEGIPFEDPLYDFNREDIAYLSKHNEGNKEVEDLQHNKLANSYNNHINDFSKRKINEDVKTNSQIKAQPETNYYNAIEAANEERKRSSSSARRGHSIPFYTDYSNFNIANLRAYYEHDNGFFRPNFDHRPLNYPQQFYEYNPYIQRSDTNLNINHYQATNVRHDRIDNNYNKGSFIRPDNHHKDHRTRNREESPTVSHGKSEFHNPMTITPLLSEKGYTTTTSTYPTPRTDFESFGEPDKSQEQNSNQFPVYSTEKPELSIQTDNASFFSGKISSDPPIKSSETQSNNNPEKSNAQMAPASTFDPNLIGGLPSSNHQSNTDQGTGFNYSQSTDNPSFPNHQLTGLAMPDEGSQIINAPFDPTLTSNIPTHDSALANTFFKPNIEPGNNSLKVNNLGANNFKPSQSNYIPGTPNIHGNNASLDYPASYNISPHGNPTLPVNKDLVVNPNKEPERASGQFETPNFDADRFFTPNLPIDHNTGDNKGPNKEAERISANFVYQSPANFNPSVSNYNSPLSSLNFMGGNKDSQAAAVDNPKLSSFHVIDTEGDLDVPTGMEGPVPAIALPPHNYVAVAPPPGFQPQFHANGYPRLYPPLRPQLYYRHSSASVF